MAISPVFLPGKFCEQRSLLAHTHTYTHTHTHRCRIRENKQTKKNKRKSNHEFYEQRNGNLSSILAWKILWTEGPVHMCVHTHTHTHTHIELEKTNKQKKNKRKSNHEIKTPEVLGNVMP